MDVLHYDPYAYEVHEDPFPTYARLREEAPAYWNESLRFWALSRHADVLAAFKDWQRFSSRFGVSIDTGTFHENASATMSFLAMDPPRHDRLRALVSKGFTPRRVAEIEPRIRALAIEHLDGFAGADRCDFIRDFAGTVLYVREKDGPVLRDIWLWELDDQSRVRRLLRAEYLVDAKSVNKVKGLPFTAGELEAAILGVLDD